MKNLIKRDLYEKLGDVARGFPVIAILGPRQSGKTTLAQLAFPNHRYVNLEDIETHRYASTDPLWRAVIFCFCFAHTTKISANVSLKVQKYFFTIPGLLANF